MHTRAYFPPWIFPLGLILGVGSVWLRLEMVRVTYSIHKVEGSLREAGDQREALLLELAALRSPARLESLARTQFALMPPQSNQVIQDLSENEQIK